jgi:hypothetical protein
MVSLHLYCYHDLYSMVFPAKIVYIFLFPACMLHVTLTVLGKITMYEVFIMNFFNFSVILYLYGFYCIIKSSLCCRLRPEDVGYDVQQGGVGASSIKSVSSTQSDTDGDPLVSVT